MPRLLVVDDEPSILRLFCDIFAKLDDLEVVTAESAEAALRLIREQRPDVALFDVMLPGMSGLDLLREAKEIDDKLPVIFITGDTNSETAIEAMRLGAFDHLIKPLDVTQIRQLVDQALRVRQFTNEPVGVSSETPVDDLEDGDRLVGSSPAMQTVYKSIGRVAPQNVTVLVRGESGAGKEMVARALYQFSGREDGPFLAVNCAAIPESLLESELFGHEKGAFTGADRRRIGKFEQCNGGTLFLDEIGDMPLPLQGKILRLLQDQKFERVGGNETIETDVRIIAATNRDLERMCQDGEYRWDLYYRLNVFTIDLPSLSQRREDIPQLISHFLRRASRELNRDVNRVAPEAMQQLENYAWPGNVRELQSVMKQSVLATTGPVVLPEFLPEIVRSGPRIATEETPAATDWSAWTEFVDNQLKEETNDIYAEALATMERSVFQRVLQHTGGNQAQAAELLGINRGTLRTKLRALGINIETVVEADVS